MSEAEQAHEHAEHAEHAAHSNEPFTKRVAAGMAILAAVLALVSVLGSMSATEELLTEVKASDAWAQYQAKSIRRYQSEVTAGVLQAMNQPAKANDLMQQAGKYRGDQDEIQKQAKEFEAESSGSGRKAHRLHLGEIFLEVAIVLSSLAILTHKETMFAASMAAGLVGGVIAASAYVLLG